jgi:hypothetical protein
VAPDRPHEVWDWPIENNVIVNITVYFEVKFYTVKVKLALTTSCTCIVALCT